MLNKTKNKFLTFSDAINEALKQEMSKDKNILIFGLGVTDPKSVFGTTKDLLKKFGEERVIEIPLSENAITGICLGLSLNGFKPILSHQRVEFSLLSLEQIINQIAKWNFMTAGKKSPSLVIRMIIGRGWGQGPQHNQSFESLFSQINGLKVVSPSNSNDAKKLLISSIRDKSPVIFFEHRWLHQIKSEVDNSTKPMKIGEPIIKKKGKDITIVSFSYMFVETLKAYNFLKKENISCEIIDLHTLRPLNIKKIIKSINKTKKLLIVENGQIDFGIGGEILRLLNLKKKILQKTDIKILGIKNSIIPSSRHLSKYCYINYENIVKEVANMCKIRKKIIFNKTDLPSDVPDKSFSGPF